HDCGEVPLFDDFAQCSQEADSNRWNIELGSDALDLEANKVVSGTARVPDRG
ncbi:MAG: hypothetical protein JWO36_4240, partial [Myxococcales bacterium]|nr:hypothetical protein [Myxococcales bacterium]